MKRRAIQTHFFCLLGMFLLLAAVAAPNASAEFYVIAGSRGVGTQIKSLPASISSPGFYYITRDLSCAVGSHGITITADNVTLDLMGFSLVGPGGKGAYDGIYMSGRANVEIRNGTVRNFLRRGICDDNSGGTGHRIINIRARDNGTSGIYLVGTSHMVERCAAVGNGGGPGIFTSTGSTVTGNTCYDNSTSGIYTSIGSTVTGNTCYDNTNCGIYASVGSTVTGNTCYANGSDGITADSGSTVTGNTCRGNTSYGINLSGNSLADQNTATNNSTGNISSCVTCTFGLNHAP